MISIVIDDHIMLRTYDADDAPALFTAINDSRAHLHPWLEWVDKTTKEEHTFHFIQHSLHQLNMQEGLALGIFCDGTIIGGVGMLKWEHDVKRAQAGYWIAKEYEGKGIISKSMTQFISYLFDRIGLNKIELHFIPANKRSARVAERLGFKIEGVIRQSIIRNGMPEDMVISGLLKSEWSLAANA